MLVFSQSRVQAVVIAVVVAMVVTAAPHRNRAPPMVANDEVKRAFQKPGVRPPKAAVRRGRAAGTVEHRPGSRQWRLLPHLVADPLRRRRENLAQADAVEHPAGWQDHPARGLRRGDLLAHRRPAATAASSRE